MKKIMIFYIKKIMKNKIIYLNYTYRKKLTIWQNHKKTHKMKKDKKMTNDIKKLINNTKIKIFYNLKIFKYKKKLNRI